MKRCLFVLGFAILFLSGCSSYQYDIFGSVSGTVTDASSGNPLGAAIVTLVPGAATVQTTADGDFQFDNLEEGQYTISAQKDGYQANRKNITIVSTEVTNVVITLSKIPE